MPVETLREHQHQLSDLNGDNSIVFGTEDTGYLTITRPVIEGGALRENTRDRPREDGVMFGTDYMGAKTVTFEVGVLTDDIAPDDAYRANLAYLDHMEGIWRHRRWRRNPEAMAMLRTCEGGETWRAYGRPRNYEEVVGPLTKHGYSNAIATFGLIDSSWYSDDEDEAVVAVSAGSIGGIKAPLKAPLGLAQPTQGWGHMTVGGTRETWPVIEFRGPISQPEVRIGDDFVLGLNGGLGTKDVIIIDPSPWVRAVYRTSDGAGMAGRLTGRSLALSDAFLDPGNYMVNLTGFDATGTGSVRVRWRNARNRPGGTWDFTNNVYVPPAVPALLRAGLWTGHGTPPEPGVNWRPEVGDEYLDLDTGTVYEFYA